MEDDQPLESQMVTRAIETAQQKVEAYNFDIRKHVVEYDDVMNDQRDMIYAERDRVLQGESMRETVLRMAEEEIDALTQSFLHAAPPDPEAFRSAIAAMLPLDDTTLPVADIEALEADAASDAAVEVAESRYEAIEAETGEERQRLVERLVLLRTIDTLWVQHLTAMDEMRQGIGLRAYGQADPLVAYKREAHDMWGQFLENLRSAVARQIFHARLTVAAQAQPQPEPQNVRESGPSMDGETSSNGDSAATSRGAAATATAVNPMRKVGRNDLCPCGSGKKYKRCHGA